MSGDVRFQQRAPHLFCVLIALALPIAILGSGRVVATYLEAKTIHATAPEDFFIKNQGLALQRTAACTPNVLLLYGASELIDPRPNRAADFFASAPTGFQVCPVGKTGATPLTILQKIAALGPDLRNRKIAVSLSPSFFFRQELDPSSYAGNFSLWAASESIFGRALDFQLKSAIAKRMQQFPETLAKSALLNVAVTRLASGRSIDRLVFVAIWPLGSLQTLVLDLQDHFETLIYLLSGQKQISRHQLHKFFAPLETPATEAEGRAHEKAVGSLINLGPAGFRERIEGAMGWVDLELLFRILQKFQTHALALSMPLDGTFYDAHGISRPERQFYYDRMNALAARYGVELRQFEDHDSDPTFQVLHHEHPTGEGWLVYDHAVDDFFHAHK